MPPCTPPEKKYPENWVSLTRSVKFGGSQEMLPPNSSASKSWIKGTKISQRKNTYAAVSSWSPNKKLTHAQSTLRCWGILWWFVSKKTSKSRCEFWKNFLGYTNQNQVSSLDGWTLDPDRSLELSTVFCTWKIGLLRPQGPDMNHLNQPSIYQFSGANLLLVSGKIPSYTHHFREGCQASKKGFS